MPDDVRNKYFNQRIGSEKGQSKDSYGIFLARGLQLLRSNGTLSYILSDTWRTIRSHRPLRKRLLRNATVFHIVDLPSWVFDATVNTCVLTLRNASCPEQHTLIAADLRPIARGSWEQLSDNLLAISGHGPDIQSLDCARYTYPQRLIASDENAPFFIGSPTLYNLLTDAQFVALGTVSDVRVGLQTGDNEYYLRKRAGARGGYGTLDDNLLLTAAELANLTQDERQNGIDPVRYGGRHFVPYDKGGESEIEGGWLPNYYVPTQYFIDWSKNAVARMKTYTTADVRRSQGRTDTIRPIDEQRVASRFQNSDYYFREGITFSYTGVYAPNFRMNSVSVFDVGGSSCFDLTMPVSMALGFLTSKVNRYIAKVFIDHTVNYQVDEFKDLLLPASVAEDRCNQVSRLVSTIMEEQRREPRYPYHLHEQRDIEALVYDVFALSQEDVREVELWYCRRYPPLAEAQGFMAEVRERYADHLARCQRILEKPPSYWRSNPILTLIAQGEGHELEFKETLEHDVRRNQRSPDVLLSSLKTIAAFLNTHGGTLLIGVSDSGEIKGLAPDLQHVRGNNQDGFEQKLRSLLTDRFEPCPLGFVDVTFEELVEGTVCQIKVRAVPASQIIHLDDDIYVRDGNVTRKLEGRGRTEWIRNRSQA